MSTHTQKQVLFTYLLLSSDVLLVVLLIGRQLLPGSIVLLIGFAFFVLQVLAKSLLGFSHLQNVTVDLSVDGQWICAVHP